jgi:integrase
MNTSLVLTLDMRRAKKDGSFPVIIRISHYNRSTSYSTGISVLEKDWDFDKKIIRKSYTGTSSVTRLNNFLIKQKVTATDIINLLKEEDKLRFMSITQLKNELTKKNQSHSFYVFTDELIADFKETERFGNAKAYSTLLGVIKGFHTSKDLTFEELNYDFLNRFENYHLAKDNTYNGLAVYMRTIRAIYNKAIKTELIDKKHYPFDKYKIKTTPTEKRALSSKDIKKILKFSLNENNQLYHTRNYFLASYLMCGMSFIDMAFLTIDKIKNGRVRYRRLKTSKIYDFVISNQLEQILEYYVSDKKNSDFVFPIIKREELELQYKDVEWARKTYNKNLIKLAEKCKINSRLTSYVSRHSFATEALLNDIPLSAISQMLGHSSLTTTQIYLKSLPNNIMDEYMNKMQIK